MELSGRQDKLFIFGGGHIGQALCRIADDLGFHITVIDDRREILDRYPSTIKTVLTDSDYRHNFPALDNRAFAVVVTRGHKCDQAVVEQALRFDCRYIGMIGSKKKIAGVKAALKEQGYSENKIDIIHAPIGLDIGAEGPHEIAVSIAAELIAVRRKTVE